MDGAQLAGVSILSISLISRHGMGLPEGTVERQQKKDYNNSKLPKVKLIYSKRLYAATGGHSLVSSRFSGLPDMILFERCSN